MKLTSTKSLLAALDHRGSLPGEQKKFDDEVWRQCGQNGAILVTDLTGFTKSTKKHGILQFLSIFRRFQLTCEPLLKKHGGELLKQEADDLFGVFPRAHQAIDAGLDMLRAVAEMNKTLETIDQMGLSVGVDYGQFLRLSDDAYGDPVNVAFKLGEDLANGGEVRVGAVAFDQAKTEKWMFDEIRVEGPILGETSGATMTHYILRLGSA